MHSLEVPHITYMRITMPSPQYEYVRVDESDDTPVPEDDYCISELPTQYDYAHVLEYPVNSRRVHRLYNDQPLK